MNFKRIIKIILGILVGYGILFLIVRIFFNLIFTQQDTIKIYQNSSAFHLLPVFLASFLITSTVVIYLFNSWLEGKWVPLRWSKVFLFMGVIAAICPTAEVLINSLSRLLVHQPIWIYQFLPVHGGDTSMVMAVIWPVYGFHMYCFQNALKARNDKTTDLDMSIFAGIDAITLEVLANLFTIFFFYTYVFYYMAGDLYHLSTGLAFIPYVVGVYMEIKILHFAEKKHHRILIGILGFLWSWILIFIL